MDLGRDKSCIACHTEDITDLHLGVDLEEAIANKSIEEAEATVLKARSLGIDCGRVLSEAKQYFNQGAFVEARSLAAEAQFRAETAIENSHSAQEAINNARTIITQGVDLDEARELLSQANESYRSGDYERAEELAEKAEDKAEETIELMDEAKSIIEGARHHKQTELSGILF